MAYIRQIQKENVVNTTAVENLQDFLNMINSKGIFYELVEGDAPIERNEVNVVFEQQQEH